MTKEWRAWEILVNQTIRDLEQMTKNVEMKWVVTKGNKHVSIKLLSFLGDIWGPMWDRDKGSEFRKFRVGLEQVWNYTCLTIEVG